MNAWFTPQTAVMFSFLSLFSVLAALGPLVKQGRYRKAVTATFAGALAAGLTLLGLGLIALYKQQPWYVVFALLLPGAIQSSIFGVLLPMIRAAYQEAEHRKIVATNL
jgi:multisubunit Na+/H+ antiporter MnhG subunit